MRLLYRNRLLKKVRLDWSGSLVSLRILYLLARAFNLVHERPWGFLSLRNSLSTHVLIFQKEQGIPAPASSGLLLNPALNDHLPLRNFARVWLIERVFWRFEALRWLSYNLARIWPQICKINRIADFWVTLLPNNALLLRMASYHPWPRRSIGN